MPIKLPSHPKMSGLREMHLAIKEHLAKGEAISIDASEVATLPIAYVQLILSAALSARSRGLPATLLNPSFPALFAFESIGVVSSSNTFDIGYAPC